MSHTPTFRTIGDLVHEHAQMNKFSTNDGKDMLSLPYENATNEAANLYLSALAIIRSQRQENDRLTAEVGRLREALEPFAELHADLTNATCHRGICSADECARCGKVIKARKALNPEEPK